MFNSFQLLDENASLIKTISDLQNVGKMSETVQYQWNLHRNLMHLASVADSNQNLQNLLPVNKKNEQQQNVENKNSPRAQ